MKLVIAFVCLMVSVSVGAQVPAEFKRPTTKIAKEITKKPVTRSESAKTLNKVWDSITKGLKTKSTSRPSFLVDSSPATKDEVLANFASILALLEDHVKRSPRPVAFKPERFRKDLDKRFYPLVAKGLVSPFGSLTTGKNGTLTPKEYGDAVGIFMVRLVDLCHLPSSKYTPNLMSGG